MMNLLKIDIEDSDFVLKNKSDKIFYHIELGNAYIVYIYLKNY